MMCAPILVNDIHSSCKNYCTTESLTLIGVNAYFLIVGIHSTSLDAPSMNVKMYQGTLEKWTNYFQGTYLTVGYGYT